MVAESIIWSFDATSTGMSLLLSFIGTSPNPTIRNMGLNLSLSKRVSVFFYSQCQVLDGFNGLKRTSLVPSYPSQTDTHTTCIIFSLLNCTELFI